MDDFEDIDSMYSAYDNWHRGMIVSRSASATLPRNGGEGMEDPEGNAGRAVPFYKTILSNISKNNQTYTVNEE